MKALVLLALFSVCNANILWQEPKTNLDVVKDSFWEYVRQATQTAEDTLNLIRDSEMGKEINTRIAQSTDTVNQYVAKLKYDMAPMSEKFMTSFNQQMEQLNTRLDTDVSAMKEAVRPYAQQTENRINELLEELKKEVTPIVESMDAETLKTLLREKSEKVRAELELRAGELQAQMVPYTQEMKDRMEQSLDEFQRTMMPLAQDFETQVNQKSQEIQQSLGVFSEDLRAKLATVEADMQAKLAALWESFSKISQ